MSGWIDLIFIAIGFIYQGFLINFLLESLILGSARHTIWLPFIHIIMAYRHVVISFLYRAEVVADPSYLNWKWTLFTYAPYSIIIYWVIQRAMVRRPYLGWLEWLLLYCNTFIVLFIAVICLPYDYLWCCIPIVLATQYLSAHWLHLNDDNYCYRACKAYWPHRTAITPPLLTVTRSLILQHTPLIDDISYIIMAYIVANEKEHKNDPTFTTYLDTMIDDIPQRLRDELWINVSPITPLSATSSLSGIVALHGDNIYDLQTQIPLQLGLSTINIYVRIPVIYQSIATYTKKYNSDNIHMYLTQHHAVIVNERTPHSIIIFMILIIGYLLRIRTIRLPRLLPPQGCQ
jgi:hypothetical protein